jgi:hypothetical protein
VIVAPLPFAQKEPETTYAFSVQFPAMFEIFEVREAGPSVVVIQVYPVRVAVMVLQEALYSLVAVKFPLVSAITFVPQTLIVAPLAPAQKEPEIV